MIGAGNTATILSKLMIKSGHRIVQVISRNRDHAQLLASSCMAKSGTLTDHVLMNADLYVIALSDAAIMGLKLQVSLKDKVICHTAGSVSIEVLKGLADSYGVLYPLQSLSKFNDLLPRIPILVDGNDHVTRKFLVDFANTLSDDVSVAGDIERMKYHLSAVFVNNFANHIFALAEDFCKMEGIHFQKLFPLMKELLYKVEKFGALQSQTGPAIRNDILTIEEHMNVLSSHPQMAKVYELLSESIHKLNIKI